MRLILALLTGRVQNEWQPAVSKVFMFESQHSVWFLPFIAYITSRARVLILALFAELKHKDSRLDVEKNPCLLKDLVWLDEVFSSASFSNSLLKGC